MRYDGKCNALCCKHIVEGVLPVWPQQGNTTGAQKDGCATKRKEREGLNSLHQPNREENAAHLCTSHTPELQGDLTRGSQQHT